MYGDDFTQSKIVRYSCSKETKMTKEKLTIQFDDKDNSLFSMHDTKYICENRNLDLCVADHDARAIVVVNQSGKLRLRYTGLYFTTKQEPFEPRGITTDSKSHILIADHSNECIHVLDQNGQFLRYIDNCGLRTPWGLCVDTIDNLIVSESSYRTVKKIRYKKTPQQNVTMCEYVIT
ncbi:protein lin-41-like [Saccostrea echinata]|uniref:protein lin-41-like n=1 Tax=Saccostrea echinata TaxID=191078 RepID=UPI002A8199C1|nr:protein lin-41-like [Saccostrea echinata]